MAAVAGMSNWSTMASFGAHRSPPSPTNLPFAYNEYAQFDASVNRVTGHFGNNVNRSNASESRLSFFVFNDGKTARGSYAPDFCCGIKYCGISVTSCDNVAN